MKETNECFEYARRVADELEEYAAGTVTDDNDEPLTMYDYVADALDIEYAVDSQKKYLGARIYVTLGGPTVWIDTREKTVELRWGTDSATALLSYDAAEQLDDIMSEIYDEF